MADYNIKNFPASACAGNPARRDGVPVQMILKGEKIVLRPVGMADAPRYVRWLADPEVKKYTTRRRITMKEERK